MNKKLLHSVVDDVAVQLPGNIALVANDLLLSYGQLRSDSNAMANSLLQLPVANGEIVATYFETGIDYVTCILGINKAGCVFMPVQVNLPEERCAAMLNLTKTDVVITDRHHLSKLALLIDAVHSAPRKIIVIDGGTHSLYRTGNEGWSDTPERMFSYQDSDTDFEMSGAEPNYLFFTSGSTGIPKGIMGKHQSLSHFIHWEKTEFEVNDTVRVSQLAPTGFDVSLRDIFLPLSSGGALIIPNKTDVADSASLLHWMLVHQITLMHMVPSLFRELMSQLDLNKSLLPSVRSLRVVLLAGEKLYYRDVTTWRHLTGGNVELVNLYGPTETTLAKVFNRIGASGPDHEIVPLGKPIANTAVLILDRSNQFCEVGEIGELCIKTPFRSLGYFNDAMLQQSKFIQNPLHDDFEDIIYRTGDLAKILPDGAIAFIGRADSQVKIRGNRLELTDVEAHVLRFPDIKEVVVITIPRSETDLALVCYFTEKAKVDIDRLKEFILSVLPEYMCPSFFVRMDSFPLNINGKIDKKALPKTDHMLYSCLEYVAPSTETEKTIARLFAEILNIDKVGVSNSFFELGGHSLLAMRILARINNTFKRSLALNEFLEHSSVRAIASLVSGAAQPALQTIDNIPAADYYEVSHAQYSMWLEQQLDPTSVAYTMCLAYRLSGPLDSNALEQALRSVMTRHETLRTTFIEKSGMPYQVIHRSPYPFLLEQRDLRALENVEQKGRAEIQAFVAKPFDLANGPLLKALTCSLDDNDHLLALSLHHIIADGWSIDVLMKELLLFYNACAEGKQILLTPLRIQYKDFAYWHRRQLAGEDAKRQGTYWREKLSGDIPTLMIPTDFERPAIKTFNGDKVFFTIPAQLVRTIRALAVKEKTTLFTVVLTAVKVLLYKYTGQRDIVIGTPIAGRSQLELEDQIGLYMNMLPIYTRIDPTKSLVELMRNIKQETLNAYKNSLFPFDRLIEELGVSRELNRSNLFDVVVQLKKNHESESSRTHPAQLLAEPFAFGINGSKYDLLFDFSETASQELNAIVDYNTDLFRRETVSDRIKSDLIDTFTLMASAQATSIRDVTYHTAAVNDDQFSGFLKSVESL